MQQRGGGAYRAHLYSLTNELPDSAAAGIQVVSCHRADDGSRRSVLIYIHGVERLGEDRRLIHVQDIHFDCSWVLEGPKMKETSV